MANKNTKLPKAPGTDGQGNIKVQGGPAVLDLSDYDDLFGDSFSETKPKSAWEEFKGGFTDALADRLNTKDVVRNFLRSAAPDGISSLFGTYDTLKGSITNIKDSIESTNAADLDYIARRAKDYLPKLKDYIPNGLYEDFNQGLENKIDDYQYAIQANRDQTSIRAANKAESENNEIKQALDQISLVSKQNFQRGERAEVYRDKANRAERGLRDALQSKRFDYMARSMGMAVDSLSRVSAYQEQFDSGIKRKGLELQFRTYMGIKDLVKLTETSLQLQMQAAEQLVRNTGTPDYQKGSNADLRKFNQRGQRQSGGLYSAAASAIPRTLQQYLGSFDGNVEKRVTNDLSQRLRDIVSTARMGENAPGLWDQKYSLAGSMAGEMVGEGIQSYLIPMLGRELRPTATKAMNRYAGGKHNQIGYLMDNLPAFAQEFVNNNQNSYGWRGKIKDIISPYVPRFGLQDKTTTGNYQTIGQQASFNQMTQRSIVEVIPGLLSRAVQELRMIRTGRDDIQREVFDVTTGKFTTERESHDNLTDRIIPKNAVRAASGTINDVLNKFDEEGNLSPGARQALAERLLRDASHNKRFDPEQYLKGSGYKEGTKADVTDELGRFFREKFEMDSKGKMADTANNHEMRQEWSQAFLDIRSISRDPYKEIERLIESGNTAPLRMMGILTTVDGQDRINYDRIWEILRGGVTGNNPYAPGGDGFDPNRPDNSGTVGHKDFMGPAYMSTPQRFAHNLMSKTRERFAPTEQAARDATARRIRELRAKYGNNMEAIAEAMKDSKGSLQDAYGKATDFTSGLTANGFGGIPGQISSAYDKAMEKLKPAEKLNSYVPQGMDQLTNLYSQFNPDVPLIKGIDFVNGDLIDVNTRKVVEKPSDITGEVINSQGLTVVTKREAAQGLVNATGEKIVTALTGIRDMVGAALAKHRGLTAGSPDPSGDSPEAKEDENKPVDLTLSPGGETVITARGIENGEYFNAKTGNPIRTLADLKGGDIVDKEGNVVVTEKEVKEGLYNRKTGKKWKLGWASKAIMSAGKFSGMTATQIGFHAMKFMGKAAVGIASRTFNFFVENQNAYLPDSQDPVFTRRDLLAGKYFDKKGKVIEDFVDVYDEILDEQGVPVLELSQYKNLKNYDGTKHQLAKNRGLMGRTVNRAIRAVRNAYISKSIQYWKWLGKKSVSVGSKVGGWAFGKSARIGGRIFDQFLKRVPEEEMATPTNMILAQILETLKAQEPEKIREGSWQDKAKKKAAAMGDKAKEMAEARGGKGMIAGLLSGLGSMLGGKKKGGNDEDDEDDDGFSLSDAADLADIGDAAGDANERRKRRKAGKGKGKGGRGKPGRLARWGNSLKNSRAGGWIAKQGGKFLATRAGIAMAGAASSFAAPIATGIAAMLSAPAWLLIGGAAVVGGAAYMGYRAYKASGEFKSLRMAQYGIDSTGEKLKVLKLEALMEKFTDKSETPQMNIAQAGGQAILDTMGIDVKDEPTVMAFSRWMEMRFKPIYLAYIRTLAQLKQSKVPLNEIDDQVPEAMKYDLLQGVKFPYEGETPYQYRDNPFDPDEKLEDNVKEIREQFEELEKKYKEASEKAKDLDKAKKDVEALKAPVENQSAAAAAAATTGAAVTAKGLAAKHKAEEPTDSGKAASGAAKVKAAVKTAALSSAAGGVVAATAYEKVGKELTALQAIRMRAYGIEALAMADVESMLTLEWVYSKDLVYRDGELEYNGDFQIFVREAGTYLGKSTAQGSDSRYEVLAWLTDRFAPAFRAYWATALSINPSANLRGLEAQLKGTDKIKIANAIIGATNLQGDAIWEVPTIFKINGKLGDLRTLAEADLKHLREQNDKELAGTPTQKASEQAAGNNNASMGGSFTDKVSQAAKSTWESAKSGVSSAWEKTKDFFGAGDPKLIEGGYKNTTGESVSGEGTSFGDFQAKGNGGKWEEIPFPSSNGSAKAAAATFKAAAAMVGIPVELMFAIAGIESNYNYLVKAKTSSATGWFQFINGTWDSMYAKCEKKYGLPPDDAQRSMRKDPRIQALLGAEFIKGNYDYLKKFLNRPITDTDIYIAHFLGNGGAKKFLTAEPSALGYQVFPKEYSANMPIFFVGSDKSKPRTIAQIYKLFSERLAKFRMNAGSTSSSTEGPQAPGETTAQTQVETQNDKAEAATEGADQGQKDAAGAADVTKETKEGEAAKTPSPGSEIRGSAPVTPGMSPSSSGGTNSGTSGTNGPSQDSGGDYAEQQRAASEESAVQAKARRDQELRRARETDKKVDDVQQKSLEALYEIRDYLKEIAAKTGNSPAANESNPSGSSSSQATGNSMNPQQVRQRAAMQRPSPLSLT